MHMAGDGCPAAHGNHVGDLLVEIKVSTLERKINYSVRTKKIEIS